MKSLDKQLREAKKCILVCANCHRGIHGGHLQVPSNYMDFYNEEQANALLLQNEEIKHGKKYYCIDCGKLISYKAQRCSECEQLNRRMISRPSREELKDLIRNKPFTQIAKKYNVSDNAIRKWCIAENLPTKKTEINKINDSEWKKI